MSSDVKLKLQHQPVIDRVLPEPFSSLVRVDVYGLSHKGLVRPNNEDHFFVVRGGRALEAIMGNLSPDIMSRRFDELFYGMAIADGLGGEVGGEIASERALESLLSMVLDTPDWMLRLGKPEVNEVMWRMADRFIRVHAGLIHDSGDDPNLQGMATTLTTAITMGDDLVITHIGDSRAYLLRKGEIKQLTRDHTLAQQLIDDGGHSPTDSLVKELRNVLRQALGAKAVDCRPEVEHLKLMDGDALLLCSDGLTDMVDDSTIDHVLTNGTSAKGMVEELLNLALENGGRDNITLIVSRYSIPPQPLTQNS